MARVLRPLAMISAAALVTLGGAQAASAAEPGFEGAEAEAQLLSGIVETGGASSTFVPGGVDSHALADLGLSIPWLDLEADATIGAEMAASGVVGSYAESALAKASIDLDDSLDARVDSIISGLHLEFGAFTASASASRSGSGVVIDSDYSLADATLTLKSPIIDGLKATLVKRVLADVAGAETAIETATIADLNSLDDTILEILDLDNVNVLSVDIVDATASLTIDAGALQTALESVLTGVVTDGPVTLDLDTGTITVDLSPTGGLNGLAPNTLLVAAVETALTTLLTDLNTEITDAVSASLKAADLAVSFGANVVVNIEVPPTIKILLLLAGIDVSVLGSDNLMALDITLSGNLGNFLPAGDASSLALGLDVELAGLSLPDQVLGWILDAFDVEVKADVVDAILNPVATTLGTKLSALTVEVAAPVNEAIADIGGLDDLLGGFVSVIVNVQEGSKDGGGPFTQRALSIRVFGEPLLNLSSATVQATPWTPVAISAPGAGTEYTVTSNDGIKDVDITGTGEPTASITVTLDGGAEQTATVADDGTWSVTFPALGKGDYAVTAAQSVDNETVDSEATTDFSIVVKLPAPAGGDALPVTGGGADLGVLLPLGMLLLAAGAGAVLFSLRRRQQA
ncbi:choice-of-anchor G family protein [Microbacterium sp.]|uniref:choice-of-anchor G family protein n=1 Tax=Microbacterium sp. TaxID=51671 RepID=UPI003A835F83